MAAERPPVDVARLRKSIPEKHRDIRAATERLNECIISFQDFVTNLEGRIEAEAYYDQESREDGTDFYTALRLRRGPKNSKTWVVEWTTAIADDPDTINFTPLIDAPLNAKLRAVEHFSDLLAAIHEKQNEIVDKIMGVVNGFSTFLSAVEAAPKGGAK